MKVDSSPLLIGISGLTLPAIALYHLKKQWLSCFGKNLLVLLALEGLLVSLGLQVLPNVLDMNIFLATLILVCWGIWWLLHIPSSFPLGADEIVETRGIALSTAGHIFVCWLWFLQLLRNNMLTSQLNVQPKQLFKTRGRQGIPICYQPHHLDAKTIADLYKERWQIELFFKWIKQNLRVKTFLGTSLNAVLTQLWITLIVYLLFAYLKFTAALGLSMQQMLRLLQLNLFDRRNLMELSKPPDLQLIVF